MAKLAFYEILQLVMRCLWVVLVAGCNLAFPLPDVPRSESCGPYGPGERVSFSAEVRDPVSDLSVSRDGSRGIVRSAYGSDANTPVTSVKHNGSGWVIDTEHQANLEVLQVQNRIVWGRLSFDGDLYTSQLVVVTQQVFRYRFQTTWQLDPVTPIAAVDGEHLIPSGPIQTSDGANHLVLRHEPTDGGRAYLSILTQASDTSAWTDDAAVTAAINEAHEAINHGMLAIGRGGIVTLIYSARDGTRTALHISELRDGRFGPPIPIVEHTVRGGNEVEPWTSPDCSVLYYRRGLELYRAEVDPTL